MLTCLHWVENRVNVKSVCIGVIIRIPDLVNHEGFSCEGFSVHFSVEQKISELENGVQGRSEFLKNEF